MIPFIDLHAQRQELKCGIDNAIAKVLDHGHFISGPEVEELEEKLSAFTKAKHCITCGNGTDALQLVLMAEDVGPGDAIFVPAFTFVASGEVVPPTGARLVFVDVQSDTFLIDPASLEVAIDDARQTGLCPRMVIAVDIFGMPADYDILGKICRKNDMILVADAAQSFGSTYHKRVAGTLADYTTTSFFPAKPLGCYGDGGAVFTDHEDKAELIKSFSVHGKGKFKYDNVRVGINSRLDTIQAAILLEKLKIFPQEIEVRQAVSSRYSTSLADLVEVPVVPDDRISAWAQYTIKTDDREGLQASCKKAGIPTVVYYPRPLHRQTGYFQERTVRTGLAVSEMLCEKVLSLPMHPYLDDTTQSEIIKSVRDFLSGR